MSDKKLNVLDLFAFVGMLIGAVVLILAQFKIGGEILQSVLYFLLFTIAAIKAYDFTRGKAKWVKVTYWVSLVIIAFCIIGLPLIRAAINN